MRKLLFTVLIFSCISAYGNPRKALKLIEKQKFDKALVLLQKSLDKDTLNPGANYILSLLYLDTAYPSYDEDLSWHYVSLAERQIDTANAKLMKRLSKDGIALRDILMQKAKVDSAAFITASRINAIASYNRFLSSHSGAAQTSEALNRRNELAWRAAEKENSWRAYELFMKTYPDADQFREAKRRYETLLYDEKTKGDNLESYIRFLDEFPHTPFRTQAEKRVFELGTAGKNVEGILWFIRNYPNSFLKGKAVNYLYHLHKENHDVNNFSMDYNLAISDSLREVIQREKLILAPIYEEGQFGFVDAQMNIVIDPSFEDIPREYACGGIESDFIHGFRDGRHVAIGRNGALICQELFDEVFDMGFGFIKTVQGDSATLWHKSGFQVFDGGYEDFGIVNEKFISFKKDGFWGLASFTGVVLLQNEFEEILTINNFIFLMKDGFYAPTNAGQIMQALNGGMPVLNYYLDDAEALEGNYLVGYLEKKQTLFDPELNTLIPLGYHQIMRTKGGWMIVKENGFEMFASDMSPIFEGSKFVQNERWFSFKRDDKWAFIANDTTFSEGFVYDSVLLIGKNFAYLEKSGENYIYCDGAGFIDLPKGAKVSLVTPAVWMRGAQPVEYLAVTIKKNKTVYDAAGRKVISGTYGDISALGNEYLSVESGGRKALMDSAGNILLKPQYEAIANYNDGYVSLLKAKKFGVYHHKNVSIAPQYETMLRPLNDTLLIARVDGFWGVIDRENKPLTPFEFSEIKVWNDSLFFVRNRDRSYALYDYKSGFPVYAGIESYKTLMEGEEKIVQILKRSQYGILSSTRGEIIAPAFSDIVNIGSLGAPLYFAQKTIREAGYIVVVYYDREGAILRRQALTEEEFENLYCE